MSFCKKCFNLGVSSSNSEKTNFGSKKMRVSNDYLTLDNAKDLN